MSRGVKFGTKLGPRTPNNAYNPLARALINLIDASPISQTEASRKAGYHPMAVTQVRTGRVKTPSIAFLVNVGQVIGYELVWRKIDDGR